MVDSKYIYSIFALNFVKRTHVLCSLMLACFCSIMYVSIYCTFNVKMPSKSYSEVPSNRTRNRWTRTTDALEECIEDQWNVNEYYKNRNISCKTSKLLIFNDTHDVNGSVGVSVSVRHFRCSKHPVPSSLYLPKTGLASFPGSGNTWVRHLLQQMTGIRTGAIYFAPELHNKGFPGEGQEQNVIAIKTHLTAVDNSRIVDFQRQILLLRNPFDAIASEYKRAVLKAGHNKHVNISMNEEWQRFLEINIRNWSYFVRVALSFPNAQLVVIYEDLRMCLLRELLNMADFLRTSTFNKFSVCCALTYSRGRNYRNQPRAPSSSMYSKQHIEDLNDMILTLSEDIAVDFPVLAQRLLNYRQNIEE